MNAKPQIKKKAKELFQKNGVQTTTLREVAKALNKSYGNITYHYKTKEEVLKDLLSDFSFKINTLLDNKSSSNSPILDYFLLSKQITKLQISFSFFYTDQLEILRKYPLLKKELDAQLNQISNLKISQLSLCQQQGFVLKNLNEKAFQTIINLEIGYFLQNYICNNNSNQKELVKNLRKIVFPYLTDKGKLIYIRN